MDCQFIKNLNKVSLLLFIPVFLINSFFQLDLFDYFLACLTTIIIFTGINNMSLFNKYVSVVLIGLGIIFLSFSDNINSLDIVTALLHNSGIVSLLITIPLIGIIFHFDDYEKYVMNLAMRFMNTELKFYSLTALIVSFFGVFINLGSIPFVYQLLFNHSKNFPENLMYKAISRGFFPNMMWAPSCIAVAVIIEYFNFSWQELAPMGFTLAVLAHFLSIFIEKFISLKNGNEISIELVANSLSKKDTLKLLALVIVLITSVVFFDFVTGKSFLVIMSLVSLIVPVILAVIYHKINVLKKETKEYILSLNDKNNECILFFAIGFFAYALRYTNIGEYITLVLSTLGFNSPITLIPFFILLVLGLSIIGVHPIITISTISLTVPINQLPISIEQLAFSLLIGYSLYQLVSPFSTAVLVLTGITHKNPLDISIKINKLYVIAFVALSTMLLVFVY